MKPRPCSGCCASPPIRRSSDAIERLVAEAPDRKLVRINALAFAAKHGLDEERVIAAFLHAAKIGLFEMSWNVLCPGCGGVLDSNATLKTVHSEDYVCSLCAANYEPTLDAMVEVTFTVSPRVRQVAAHNPDDAAADRVFPAALFQLGAGRCRRISSGVGGDRRSNRSSLPPGEKAIISLQLPAKFIIVFDPVTHTAQFIDVKGEPTKERQALSLIFDTEHAAASDGRDAAGAAAADAWRTAPTGGLSRPSSSPTTSCTTS